jgi:CubicO group peptidase (beta-lactamase class C family)
MYLKRLFIICFTAFLIQSCSNKEEVIQSYFGFSVSKESVDEHLEKEMKRLNMPGMSIAFINEGKVVHHQTFGFSNREDRIKVNDKTIFEGASLSKPLFAYFVLKYVENGLIDLDTPLYTYLPYEDIAYDDRYKKITARMVLSHTAGFPNWRSDYPENKLFLKFDPGTDFFYSGEGYQYLAMVLKHLEQTDWAGLERSFQNKVAKPLKMEHTVFIQDAYCMEHKAEAYDEDGKWISPEMDTDSSDRYEFIAPASVHSEPIDFSKWLIALMNKEGLTSASFQELFKAQSFAGDFSSIDVDYTLGFFKPRLPLTNIVLHSGNNYGFTSYFAIDPDKKWGFVLFTNSEYGEQLGNEFLLHLLLTNSYLIIGILLVLILSALFLLISILIKRMKRAE